MDSSLSIDHTFQHTEASRVGRAERYGHGTSPHTLNVWWARRPLSTMEMIVGLALKGVTGTPRVLDPFGGGGTSAMAAARLGCEVDSADANELAVFVQRTALEYPQVFADPEELIAVVRQTGTDILSRLKTETETMFPLRQHGVTNYLWSHRQKCCNCGFLFMLSRRTGIRHRPGKRALNFVFVDNAEGQTAKPGADGEATSPSNWHNRRGSVSCPKCGFSQRASIRANSDVCCALVQSPRGNAKQYHPPHAFARRPVPAIPTLQRRINSLLSSHDLSLPDAPLRRWSGIINPAIYGLRRYSDLFNRRQSWVFLQLTDIFLQAYHSFHTANGEPKAKAVFALLSGLFDQLIDWNCRLSMWIPQNEQVGRAFCGPGVSMLWDYCETDPCGDGPANLWSKLNRIVNGCRALALMRGPVRIHHFSALGLPFKTQTFDAVVTDPPYYDNIHYAALADFFYTWKRLPLQRIFPVEFAAPLSSADDEIVCSEYIHGKHAHSFYVDRLATALIEAQRVLRDNGCLALVFGHSSLRGWEALIEAFRKANLQVTSAEPLGIERPHRPRAVRSNAVNTCTVFFCRKSNGTSLPLHCTQDNLIDYSSPTLLANSLIASGWSREDAAMAEFSRRIIPLINHPTNTPIPNLLLSIESSIASSFPEFKLKHRR